MPKELIHLQVTAAAADRLADTRFAPCLATERPALLLGGLFHDALFYALGRGEASLEELAHRFHCVHGEDPFELPVLQLRHAAATPHRARAAAVFVGLIAHLFTDARFHPLVWHCTGDYYAPDPAARSLARQRHRAIEGLMDRVACPDLFAVPAWRIGPLLARCPDFVTTALPLDGLAGLAGLDRDRTTRALDAAWTRFGRMQRLGEVQPLARLLHALRPMLPTAGREFESLFHAPQLLRQAPSLAGEITYRHPVTGDPQRIDLIRAMDEAANLAAACCRSLEGAVFDGAPPTTPPCLPSLETGWPCVPADHMTCFADPPFPDLS